MQSLAFALLEKIGALSIYIVLGFIAVRFKIMKYDDSKAISAFALYFVTPCAMLDAFQYEYSSEKLLGMGIALLGVLIVCAVFGVLSAVLKKPLKLSDVDYLSMLYPNAGNFILPLITMALGGDWVIYCCPFFMVMNLMLFTHCKSVLSGEKSFRWSMIFKNVVIISALIGFVMFLCNYKLPGVLGSVVTDFGRMMGPLYMFVVGMIIGNAELKRVFFNKRAYLVCLGRLVLYPLSAMLVLRLSGLLAIHPDAANILLIVVITAGAPAAVMVTQFAQMYRSEEEAAFASSVNIISSLLCLFTIPALAKLYELII